MAIYEHSFYIGMKDINTKKQLNNTAILSFFEEIGCLHSNLAGYGLKHIEETHLSWVILHWKIKVLKRPLYDETITIKTWARASQKFFTYRDYEMYNNKGELLIIGTSKWSLVDIQKGGIVRITEDLITCYAPESKSVFEEPEVDKLKEPTLENLATFSFPVLKKDIDINEHMHNLSYLDYGCEALPLSILKEDFNNFEVMYKRGAKLGETINCYYTPLGNEHFISMKSSDSSILHAIIKLF